MSAPDIVPRIALVRLAAHQVDVRLGISAVSNPRINMRSHDKDGM
jgi:hypothetical protein